MHAYLIIGNNPEIIITDLLNTIGAKRIDYSITKIDDARDLQKEVKLSLSEKTAYVIKNIHAATESSLNALLKNLEEPQDNLFFILTSHNESSVLPTITSRCQIKYVSNDIPEGSEKDTIEFIKMSTGKKLSYTEKYKDRSDTKIFLTDLIKSFHQLLHKYPARASVLANYIEQFTVTLNRVEANGNVNLHLTNMVLSLVK